jgi:hypothetical protein
MSACGHWELGPEATRLADHLTRGRAGADRAATALSRPA